MKKDSFCTDRKIRIYDKKVADQILEIYDMKNPRYTNYNSIMVEAMKFGLPIILEEVAPQNSIAKTVSREGDRIIKHMNRLYAKQMKETKKILISSILTQEMMTLLVNEVEQVLEKNEIRITDKIREKLKEDLPEPFKSELESLIEKMTEDDT